MRLAVRLSDSLSPVPSFLASELCPELSAQGVVRLVLPAKYSYQLVPAGSPADICLCAEGASDIRQNEINICLCEASCAQPVHPVSVCITGGTDYAHRQAPTIPRYLVSIPRIALRCHHFRRFQFNQPTATGSPFDERKFALVATRSPLTSIESSLVQSLLEVGQVDFMGQHQFDYLTGKGTHAERAAEREMHKYKFIVLTGESDGPDEACRKILSVFRASSIPVYAGGGDPERYVSSGTYIAAADKEHDSAVKKVKIINACERLFTSIVETSKLNYDINASSLPDYLDPFLTPDKIASGVDEVSSRKQPRSDSGWL